jgi:hypothetical protein
MIINKFEQIKSFLTFKSEDAFYHIQILKRKKDCAEHERGRNNNARCIKTYYITSIEYFDTHIGEIIKLCELFNARAYINLNTKSFEKVAFELNKQLADRLQYKQFRYCYRLYETVTGGGYDETNEDGLSEIVDPSKVNVGEKRWIIDVDTKNEETLQLTSIEINKCQSNQSQVSSGSYMNVITQIPTLNGWHIITHPFNLKQLEPFKALYPFDVQKNNPTLLYFNKYEEETN